MDELQNPHSQSGYDCSGNQLSNPFYRNLQSSSSQSSFFSQSMENILLIKKLSLFSRSLFWASKWPSSLASCQESTRRQHQAQQSLPGLWPASFIFRWFASTSSTPQTTTPQDCTRNSSQKTPWAWGSIGKCWCKNCKTHGRGLCLWRSEKSLRDCPE